MIISDLNYIENVSDEATVNGGWFFRFAIADADASALAIGPRTYSDTYTNATAVKGVFSLSYSSSKAAAF